MDTKEFIEIRHLEDRVLKVFWPQIKKNKRGKYYNRCRLSLLNSRRCRCRVRQFYSPWSQYFLLEYKRHITNFFIYLHEAETDQEP